MPNVREDTGNSYRGILEKWIRPRWGTHTLQSVKTMAVESWIKSIPRSPNTRAHIRNMIHLLFNCAVRWEWSTETRSTSSDNRASAQKFLAS